MKRLFILGLTAAVLCLAASCSRARAPNIILIVVDTLRPDRLGAYGNPRHLSPFVDSLAARGYVFRHAYAQSSWTNPSVASLLTSRFQSQHGIIGFESVLADSELTLAEVLKQRGYTTGFFSANGMIAKHMGFGQGYDEWSSILVQPTDQPRYMWIPERAARINRDALAWLDSLSSPSAPIFLHLHYMEPHNPYAPRPEALAHVADGGPPPNAERANSSVLFGHALPVKPEVLRNVQDVYDAEVLSLDIELRSLFEELERRHVLDHSIVVFTADHGEELKEHGFIGHDKTLFEEVVRVPLILALPGQTERVDVESLVSLVDVAPSLVDLAGGTVPPAFEGHSWTGTLVRDPRPRFLPWGQPQPRDTRQRTGTAYTELIKPPDHKRFTPHEHAVVSGTHKLIVGVGGEHEYYDLAADPGETNPQALSDAERRELQEAYERVRTHAIEHAAPRATQALDEETKERMRALGYVKDAPTAPQ
jgi:arylsulfatase A-like enzyme